MVPMEDDDPVTPADLEHAEDAARSDKHYEAFELAALELSDQLAKADDLVDELVAERDMARRELADTQAELAELKRSKAWAREIEANRRQGRSGFMPRSRYGS